MTKTENYYAIIGAGPMGLATAKVFKEYGIPFVGFEAHSDVGGLWDIDSEKSTMYESAHLISSKTMTEFADFPMDECVAEYPSHNEMKKYFRAFAKNFDLYNHYEFETEVMSTIPLGSDGEGWQVTTRDKKGNEVTRKFKGVVIANGTLSEPNMPSFDGQFDGELIHSSAYRYQSQFRDKRILIIGAGNSGCDIAVDAIHHGQSCDISFRRGYYFVPKYVFGKPADTIGGKIKLPKWLKPKIDKFILSWFVGDPQKYGFPKPDYKLYESHPIVNSLILFHAGHGDIEVKADIQKFDGKTVHFKDGTSQDYDMIVAATGYKLHYPFIDNELLNWQGSAPHLYLNVMHPNRDDLFVMGMVEASGLGWQGRHEQAEFVAKYLTQSSSDEAQNIKETKAATFARETGGRNYLDLPRMAYYVDKDAYLKTLRSHTKAMGDSK